jgi:hypothetical protein
MRTMPKGRKVRVFRDIKNTSPRKEGMAVHL